MRQREHAGTAILWKKTLSHIIDPIPEGSDRIAAITLKTWPSPILIVNTYMPTEGAASANYDEILDEVHTLYTKHAEKNADLDRGYKCGPKEE